MLFGRAGSFSRVLSACPVVAADPVYFEAIEAGWKRTGPAHRLRVSPTA
ncbi:MAG: hypothetical protein GXP62_10055 [Oligoflexia bacterium]|nr:hypothetical protein [Oligoflexia bacterium]